MSIHDVHAVLEAFDKRRVLLIGDTIVDVYTYGKALGLSAETPTIVARKGEVKQTLGGAAFVCRNLLELGAAVDFVTLIGDDEESAAVSAFKAPKLNLVAVPDSNRRTTVKHRFWVDGYKLFQLDTRDDFPIEAPIEAKVRGIVAELIPTVDCVIISDYRHGLLSPSLIRDLTQLLVTSGKRYFVDSQVSQSKSNHLEYRGGGVMCMNLREARHIDPGFDPKADSAALLRLNRMLDSSGIIIKLGEDGALLLDGTRVLHVPAETVPVVDTTGAGDAFLAAFSLCADAPPEIALKLANSWAGLSIGIRGTSLPRKADLWKAAGVV